MDDHPVTNDLIKQSQGTPYLPTVSSGTMASVQRDWVAFHLFRKLDGLLYHAWLNGALALVSCPATQVSSGG